MSNHLRFDTDELNRVFVGFDQLFTQLKSQFDHPVRDTYPPFNIVKINEDEYTIELAVAGFSKDEVKVKVENNMLTISGKKVPSQETPNFLHRSLASRNFERSFRLSEYMVVKGAVIENGILTVTAERIVPEEKKPRYIDIT